MLNYILTQLAGQRVPVQKAQPFNAMNSRYVDGLTSLYAQVYRR